MLEMYSTGPQLIETAGLYLAFVGQYALLAQIVLISMNYHYSLQYVDNSLDVAWPIWTILE